MRQIAIYGKGGIGKSTVSAHVTYCLAEKGMKVLQIGCDPKNDSTHALVTEYPRPILDVLRDKDFEYDDVAVEDIIMTSPLTFASGGVIYCAESGGPEPGVGCGGKGVIEAIETLDRLDIYRELELDAVIYDILGDVVCGGFSLPIRQGYAKETYVVTSGELEALYQVTNVLTAVRRFARRSGAKLGGLIVNLRKISNEEQMVYNFAEKLGTKIVGVNQFSQLVKQASGQGRTVFHDHPDSPEAVNYRKIAEAMLGNTDFTIPETMPFEELYEWWLGYVK